MKYDITLTNDNGDKLDNSFRFGADDVRWSVMVDDAEYTGKLIYNPVKDDYEVEPDNDMPEPWEEIDDAIQKQFTETLGALK
jgi:hypothetical protein